MFHLDLRLLRSFAAVAYESSVTRAAERLNLTQPTVSGQIKELEQELGFALFHRTTRRVQLSEQGERLLPLVEAILRRSEDLRIEVEEMQLAKRMRFRLGAAMYTMDFEDRINLLDAFAAAMPDVHYTIDNRLQSAQVPDLLSERLDAAILLGIAVPMESSEHPSRSTDAGLIVNETQYPDSLDRVVIRRRSIGLLVPVELPLACHEIIPQTELAGHKIAMLGTEHGEALINPIASFLLKAGAVPLSLAEGNALAVQRHAARNRLCALGIGWFPPPSDMVLRPVEGMNAFLDLSVVLGKSPNKAARRFFEFASKWQAEREQSFAKASVDSDARSEPPSRRASSRGSAVTLQ